MAHPYHHALSSVKKWGGETEDYQAIHNYPKFGRKEMTLCLEAVRIVVAKPKLSHFCAASVRCRTWLI